MFCKRATEGKLEVRCERELTYLRMGLMQVQKAVIPQLTINKRQPDWKFSGPKESCYFSH